MNSSITTWLRAIAAWFIVLGIGLVLLSGRYQWGGESQEVSRVAYVSSAYMLIVLLPALYYGLLYFVNKQTIATIVTAISWVICTLPYQWLGLNSWYYYANHFRWQSWNQPDLPPSSTNWMPDALFQPEAIPYGNLFFIGMFVIGLLIAGFIWLRTDRASQQINKFRIVLFVCMYGLILLQSWAHLSMRSPYTYIPHYEQQIPNNYWYHMYLFPNNQGAVNADYPVFRAIEEHFIGDKTVVFRMLLRRSIIMYISSQFSYFFNAYYVYLVMNVLFWFASAVSILFFTKYVANEDAANFSALLAASASGFIMFVAQPMSYLIGYSMMAIMMYLFVSMFIEGKSWKDQMLFGWILGIASLVYDIFPLYVAFILYVFYIKKGRIAISLSIILSFIVYSGFNLVQGNILGIKLSDAESLNVVLMYLPARNINTLISSFNASAWYEFIVTFPDRYVGHIMRSFNVIVALIAIPGIVLAWRLQKRFLLLIFLLPSLLLSVYLHFGSSELTIMPRFVYYLVYPVIYALAGLTLVRLQNISKFIPWVVVAAIIIVNNVDVFGLPVLYYHFYWTSPGYTVPVIP